MDVTIELSGDPATLLAELNPAGFDLRSGVDEEFIRRTRVIPLTHRPTKMPVDLVLAGPGLEEEFLARAIPVDVAGMTVPFISPEDLLIAKVLAGRPKDVEDIRGILRTRLRALDLERVRSTLQILDQALDRSDLVSLFEGELRAIQNS